MPDLLAKAPPPYVALDLETTTPSPASARIIEMTLVRIDKDVRARGGFTQRLNPGTPIPPDSTQIHGIKDTDVHDQPRFEAIAGRVQAFLRDATLIAYNGRRFDVPVLHRHLRQAGQLGVQANPVLDPYL